MIRVLRTVLSVVLCLELLPTTKSPGDETAATQIWARQALLNKGAADRARNGLESHRLPFSFVYAGAPSVKFLASWNATTTNITPADGKEKHVITYSDPATGLQLVCELTLFTDFPAVEWVLRMRNNGSADTPIIENVRPLDLGISRPVDDKVALHRCRGSTCEPTDFLPIDDPVPAGANIGLAPNGGRSSDGALPFFNLQWQGGGVVVAIGWSGQWALRLRRERSGELLVQAGQQTTHFTLHPGESVRMPRILLLPWQGDDPLHGNNLFRRLLAAHYLPKRNGETVVAPLAWLSFFGFDGNGVNEENQLDWINRTADRGADCYWLDAGWFEGGWPKGAGNWTPATKQFPRGLKPLGDAAHKRNMRFALWFEPERVTPKSRIAKEHPEWVLHADARNRVAPTLEPGEGLFDLGNPAARDWLTSFLLGFVREWSVDVFRMDCNIDLLCFWKAADTPDRQGIAEMRYVEGLYRFWDDLVRSQPGLLIDNCASGGRRIDLETVSRSYTLSRSDMAGWVTAGFSVWNQSQTAGLSLYVPQHAGGLWSFAPYAFRSTTTTCTAINLDVRAEDGKMPAIPAAVVLGGAISLQDGIAADGALASASGALAEVKELRPLYFGDYYPLTEINVDQRTWCGWQYDRPELGRGFAMLFRRPQAANARVEVALRGLDLKAKHSVEFRETYETKERRTMTGAELSRLRVEIGSAPGSMLILYRKDNDAAK